MTVNGAKGAKAYGTADANTSILFADAVVAKIWKTATEHLKRESFPETVPQSGVANGQYQYRDAEFWTCGFFPGSLFCLLERSIRYPQAFLGGNECREELRTALHEVCRDWAEPIHDMAYRTDTHDIGFIVEPALRRHYELTGDRRSYESVLTAAHSLATRYSDVARAIRSWDTFVNNGHNFDTKDTCFLVIIDSMCNLDLLYYAGHQSGSQRLIDIATTHAHTVRKTHLRKIPNTSRTEYATCHVADVCPSTGEVRKRLTAQGYADESTWARGQAWAVLGYAQTYVWTKDRVFLETACGLADHFIARMEDSPACVEEGRAGRYVPLWDFDAPADEAAPLRDSSAGMIAANGLLILANALAALGEDDAKRYLGYAMKIVADTIALCFAHDGAKLVTDGAKVMTKGDVFEGILKRATANYNANWSEKWFDHGLVYGDYYFLEFGNRLLQMGYV